MDVTIIADIIILVIALLIGIPVPFSFAVAFLFIVLVGNYDYAFLIPAGFAKTSSIVLLTIPLFIVAGSIMGEGGIARRLLDLAESILGRIKGGIGIITVITTGVFSAISGSAAAATSAMGSIMMPQLRKAGYGTGFSAVFIANGAIIDLLIPPSAAQILYGWSTGTSIAACFLATVIPGLILMLFLGIQNYFYAVKHNIKIPDIKDSDSKSRIKIIAIKTKDSFWALLMPIFVLGVIYGGIATPTEAAALTVVYALIVSLFVYREMKPKRLWQIMVAAGTTSGVIMVLVFFVSALARIYTMEDLPTHLLDALIGFSDNKYVILLIVNLFLLVIGMLMDDVAGILLCAPILLPIVTTIGVHPVHFAAIIGVNLGMGLVTPPVAPILYFSGRICGSNFEEMFRPAIFSVLIIWLPLVLITTYIPSLSLFLPKLLGLL